MFLKNNQWLRRKELEILSRISPKEATKKIYKQVFGKAINLDRPKYFCEKLHYLKLNTYYNNPLVTTCIDKYAVKKYMKCMGKEELCPVLYGVYERPEDIEWDKFPRQFVIKCTHGCDYNIICYDKRRFKTECAEKQLKLWLKEDYWVKYAETQYRFIKKRIIVEEYLGRGLITYRFCCFQGEPKLIYIMEDEKEMNYIDYFDIQWNKLDYRWEGRDSYPITLEKPENLEEMLDTARELSKGFPFVRIDLYSVNGRIYLSEFTFVPAGGVMKFENKNVARLLGRWIDLE